MALVEVRDLHKTYLAGQVKVPALRGVSFDVNPGELVGLMGPSGSGKSTLLHILGLLDGPTSGSYRFDGKPCEFKDHNQFAKLRSEQIGFVFQSFNLVPVLTAAENVELPMMWAPKKKSPSDRRKRALELLSGVGIGDLADRRPSELSGGQQQRVAIARSLCNAPRLVLADEPTANLDGESALSVVKLLGELCRRENTAFVVSTHDARIVPYLGRVLRMADGQLSGEERIQAA